MSAPYPRVLPVGDRAVTVELGSALDEDTVGRVRTLDARVAAAALAGVIEAVPTFASLLVIYDRKRIPYARLREELLALANELPVSTPAGRLAEVPVRYDGEDLKDVAAACGLTPEDVIELHAGREYAVLMLGFSPGFAYMGFVDEKLRLPRRKTPRTRVPAGSVAIAGPQTGIYPRTLPGGWNLLGTTTVPLFDASVAPGEGPSRLMPGDRVRFKPTTTLPPVAVPAAMSYSGSGVRVLESGILTTVQDAGRPGLRRLAVPLTGYADPAAARLANACLGRAEDAPVIEICGPGLKLHFESATFVAVSGATVTADLQRGDLERATPLPMNAAVRVRPGNTLTVKALENGVRAYLAIAGMRAPRLLGSASADLGSRFLRPLEAGDGLALDPFAPDAIPREVLSPVPRTSTVRVVLGPQVQHFDEQTIQAFLATPWRVGLDSDRVGARLDGPRLRHAGANEIVSDGMVPGCVQVPPDGRPIVMLSDCPTTGGYPKIACVVSDDLGTIAQAVPGTTEIRFRAVRVEDI
jgi:KipI family sensor histidine kinase inhibitor